MMDSKLRSYSGTLSRRSLKIGWAGKWALPQRMEYESTPKMPSSPHVIPKEQESSYNNCKLIFANLDVDRLPLVAGVLISVAQDLDEPWVRSQC